jgi:hypothetical protein
MSKAWKWVLGIVIGFVVVVMLVGGGFLVYARFNEPEDAREVRFEFGMRRGELWHDAPLRLPMRAYSRIYRNYLPGGIFFGGLICLGTVGLLVGGAFALAYSLGRRRRDETPADSVVTPTDAKPEPVQDRKTCPNCQQEVQADWAHCANCGNSLAPS